jgi:GH15 family glucan-1,4-alpha-glucosidase
MTTSLPEAPGTGRTWDYRYCWLRDSYYTLGAFRHLGQFEEREQFLSFLLNVAASSPELELAPLYGIDGTPGPEERTEKDWAGYNGDGPVRVGNQASAHRQHDVFGEMVLALTPMFLDARFSNAITPPVLDLVTRLTRKAMSVAGQPDAGIWEFRGNWRPQTFSTLMCWAAADRMAKVAKLHRPEAAAEFTDAAARIKDEILKNAVDSRRKCLVADYGGTEVDAALLQAVTLRLLPLSDPRLKFTVEAVRADLEHEGWLKRYRTTDDFGVPSMAFMLCTYWLVEALALLGQREQARELMDKLKRIGSPLGLLAEHIDPKTGLMWGNFPQAYSHVGLIHAAFAASPRWNDAE